MSAGGEKKDIIDEILNRNYNAYIFKSLEEEIKETDDTYYELISNLEIKEDTELPY